jgi:hypothetical protein
MAGWHFVTLPAVLSAEIRGAHGKKARGWGSLPIRITVGKTGWNTSIFPDKKAGAYLLPLKAEVRKREGIRAGDVIAMTVTMRV